jgi:hypothetical protein
VKKYCKINLLREFPETPWHDSESAYESYSECIRKNVYGNDRACDSFRPGYASSTMEEDSMTRVLNLKHQIVRYLAVGCFITAGSVVTQTITTSKAYADDQEIARAIREADKVVGNRTIRAKRSTAEGLGKSGANFSGNWSGTYVKVRSNCSLDLNSFSFRHALRQSGGRAVLNTSHDGEFFGTSRDRGRRLEFGKRITLRNGGTCGLGIVYKDIARNRRTTNTGYGVACGSCVVGFGAQARQ